jgi:hypothetical protein
MEYTYEDCLAQTLSQIKRYSTARRNRSEWDKWEFQDIRDELAEALVFFGPHYADLRAESEQREVDRKLKFEKRRLYWRSYYKGERGTASLAESKALEDCEDELNNEVEANRLYYQARELISRLDQVLNSIASRLKLDKHDKEG